MWVQWVRGPKIKNYAHRRLTDQRTKSNGQNGCEENQRRTPTQSGRVTPKRETKPSSIESPISNEQASHDAAEVRPVSGEQPSAHLFGIVACLLIADRRFVGGWFRFAFGNPPARLGRRVALVFFASILAIGLCPLIGEATVRVILHFWPSYQFDPHPTIKALHDGLQPQWVVVGLWIGAVAVAPIAEEFFFRGLLQSLLAGIVSNRWLAIGLSAAVFGTVHLSQPETIVALTALGVLLGYAYERTGALVAPIMIHAVFNLKTLIWDALA